MSQEPNDFVADAKEQVATHTCEGSHHNHDLIVGLLTEVERLKEGWETAFNISVSEQEQNKKLRTEIEKLITECANREAVLRDLIRAWDAPSAFPPQDVADLMSALRAIVERAREHVARSSELVVEQVSSWKDRFEHLQGSNFSLRAEIGRLREIGNASFMAMCAFRDSNDEESFQDAIDALGAALKGQTMTEEESECWASAQRWHEKYLKAEAEIERLQAEKSEMADAILQIAGSSEMHFRTLVSFELAEFVFTGRVAAALDRKL